MPSQLFADTFHNSTPAPARAHCIKTFVQGEARIGSRIEKEGAPV